MALSSTIRRQISAVSAVVVLLALPIAAWAVTTSPAAPLTISITRTGHPRCTTLKYHLDKFTPWVKLSVHSPDNTRLGWRVANVPSGDRSFRWCAYTDKPLHAGPGTYRWRIYRLDSQKLITSRSVERHFQVVP